MLARCGRLALPYTDTVFAEQNSKPQLFTWGLLTQSVLDSVLHTWPEAGGGVGGEYFRVCSYSVVRSVGAVQQQL